LSLLKEINQVIQLNISAEAHYLPPEKKLTHVFDTNALTQKTP